jgi:tetrahydromethanopterin S-methyltransferase subunit G
VAGRVDVTDQYRIIGQLEAQMDSAEERLNRIETKLDVLTEYIQQQKGGAKLIWAIAGAGGIVGVSVMKLGSMLLAAIRGAP